MLQALDRASETVSFCKTQRLMVDLRAATMATQLGTLPSELLASAALSCSGSIILARMRTLPSLTNVLQMPVTGWHIAEVSVAAPSCRPPLKAYTDVTVKVTGLVVGATAGLEPAFAALSKASRRIVPPGEVNADASVPPADPTGATLAWWDRVRYMWRGRGKLLLSNSAVVISLSHAPAAAAHHQRAVLTAKDAEIVSEPDGQMHMHWQRTQADLFMQQHEKRSRPGAESLRVPLFVLAAMRIAVSLSCSLRDGRGAGNHHVFPCLLGDADAPAGAQQGPVDVVGAFKAVSVNLSVDVTVRSSGPTPGQVRSVHGLRHAHTSLPCCIAPSA